MDQYNDKKHEVLAKYLPTIKFPDYVGKTLYDLEKVATLQEKDFAWPEVSLFPTHTKGDTFLSALYFFDQYDNFTKEAADKILGNILESAVLHEISSDIVDLMKQANENNIKQHSGLPTEDFAYVTEHKGSVKQMYPIKSASDASKAQSYFEENYSKYPVEWREGIAKGIVDLSNKYAADITSEKVKQYGGQVDTDFEKTSEAIKHRISYCSDTSAAETYGAIVELIEKEASLEDINRYLLVECISQLDEQTGLNKLVKRGFFPDAHGTVYNKETEGTKQKLVDLNGEIFTEDDLANTSRERYLAALGEDFVKSVSDPSGTIDMVKLLEIVPTLPKDDKSALALVIERTTYAGGGACHRAYAKDITKSAGLSPKALKLAAYFGIPAAAFMAGSLQNTSRVPASEFKRTHKA